MNLPNFLFIGPPKTGSTWLYQVLTQHPDVFVPALKDLYFFDRHYERGLGWYAKQFSESNGAVAVGEISHDYIYSPEACARIRRDLPAVKLVTILRDPTDRAISHYKYSRRFGNVTGSFLQASRQNPNILDCGLYAKHLLPFFDSFRPEQLGVFFFDDLQKNPTDLGQRLFRFLGLDETYPVEFNQKVNGQAVSRSVWISRAARSGAHLTRKLGWTALLGKAKNSSLLRRALFRDVTNSDSVDFDLDGAEDLCQEFYANDLSSLSTLLGGHQPQWLKQSSAVL